MACQRGKNTTDRQISRTHTPFIRMTVNALTHIVIFNFLMIEDRLALAESDFRKKLLHSQAQL